MGVKWIFKFYVLKVRFFFSLQYCLDVVGFVESKVGDVSLLGMFLKKILEF